jgi:hypothetical protein
MFLSVITTGFGYFNTEEMLIPKTIGATNKGYTQLRRLDRALTVGHRFRGDVGVEF